MPSTYPNYTLITEAPLTPGEVYRVPHAVQEELANMLITAYPILDKVHIGSLVSVHSHGSIGYATVWEERRSKALYGKPSSRTSVLSAKVRLGYGMTATEMTRGLFPLLCQRMDADLLKYEGDHPEALALRSTLLLKGTP